MRQREYVEILSTQEESTLHRVESIQCAVIRNRVDAKSGYFLSSGDVTRSDGPVLSLNIQDGAERNVIASFLLGL